MKRGFDIVVAVCGLIALSPLLAVLALAVRTAMGSPVLFRQTRPGLNGEPFVIRKFRTMRDERNSVGELLSDGERLTSVGTFLRRTSLDELPELWNVLKGDMSLVGPRPLLMEYLPLYTDRQRKRHDVRPGITGLAQVMGRNAISWAERLEHDVAYVETRTFWLDVKILLVSIAKVVRAEGITQPGRATVEKFRGDRA